MVIQVSPQNPPGHLCFLEGQVLFNYRNLPLSLHWAFFGVGSVCFECNTEFVATYKQTTLPTS